MYGLENLFQLLDKFFNRIGSKCSCQVAYDRYYCAGMSCMQSLRNNFNDWGWLSANQELLHGSYFVQLYSLLPRFNNFREKISPPSLLDTDLDFSTDLLSKINNYVGEIWIEEWSKYCK